MSMSLLTRVALKSHHILQSQTFVGVGDGEMSRGIERNVDAHFEELLPPPGVAGRNNNRVI